MQCWAPANRLLLSKDWPCASAELWERLKRERQTSPPSKWIDGLLQRCPKKLLHRRAFPFLSPHRGAQTREEPPRPYKTHWGGGRTGGARSQPAPDPWTGGASAAGAAIGRLALPCPALALARLPLPPPLLPQGLGPGLRRLSPQSLPGGAGPVPLDASEPGKGS